MLVHQLIRRSGVRLFRPAGSGRAFTAGVPWHASIGAAVADEDSATSGGDLVELKDYVMAKALWDPTVDVRALLSDPSSRSSTISLHPRSLRDAL